MIKKNNFKLIIISIMILGVLLLLLLNGCSLFRQYGSIEGYVYVPDTDNKAKGAIIIREINQVPTGYKPLPGARVSVQDSYEFVFTNINGYFLLEHVETGVVNLLIEPPVNSGYNALTTQAIIEPDTTVPIGTYGAVSLPSEGADHWDVTINKIDTTNWPEVKVYVQVIDPINDSPIIGANDFKVDINGHEIGYLTVQSAGASASSSSSSLVIDRSGSMSGTELSDAKDAAKTFVGFMTANDRAEVVSFASSVTVDQSFTNDKSALYNAIDNLYATGWTALYDGIWKGLDDTALETTERKAVIALTDGEENDSSSEHGGGSSPDNSDVIGHAKKFNIPVYTIGLGLSKGFTVEEGVRISRDFDPTEDLRQIAEDTGGEFFDAPTSSDLEHIYVQITQRIQQQYIITFTDNTGITDGILTVKVNYNQISGEASKDYKPLAQEYEGEVEVPLSPFEDYSSSNKNWWLYQFEGYPPTKKNVNCGPACTAMVINYFKGLDVTTTYQGENFPGYPDVNCYARWNYCEINLPGGFYCSDWYVPGRMGATSDQIINVLSSEGIDTQKFTGYNFLQSEGEGMVKKIKEYIYQGLLCICEVDVCEYAITCDEGKDHTHWVVAYGYDDNNIYLNDSGYRNDGQGRKVSNETFANALWQFKGLSVFITCSY